MNHVNCPRGITIFAQLLYNFLLLWHFTVLSFKLCLQLALIRHTEVRSFVLTDAITPLGEAKINLKSSQSANVRESPE